MTRYNLKKLADGIFLILESRESEPEVRRHYELSRPALCGVLPPARLRVLKVAHHLPNRATNWDETMATYKASNWE